MQDLFIFATPVFTLFMLAEWLTGRRQGRQPYEVRDTAASLAMGAGSLLLGLGGDLLLYGAAKALNTLAPWEVPATWWGWALAMVLVDLAFYWCHRAHHEVRVFWAAHVNHHSSERFNLATALRQSWTEPYTSIPFFLPLALLGFSPELIMGSFAINLLYQFLTHTELVGRLGVLEWVLNTPSHHRVHHGSNLRYLDKNYAGMLIVWDRLFGTFEPEAERVVYGLTTNIGSFNPFWIAFHEWVALARDVVRARRPLTRLRHLVRPPGWSPDGSTLTVDELRRQAELEAQQAAFTPTERAAA